MATLVQCPGGESVPGWKQDPPGSDTVVCPVCGWKRHQLIGPRGHTVDLDSIPIEFRHLVNAAAAKPQP